VDIPKPIQALSPVTIFLAPDDARTLFGLVLRSLAEPPASTEQRSVLLSLACQLRQALRK
jgi:hypothetical protein